MIGDIINARQYFIRIRDSFNDWVTIADSDKEVFTSLVNEHMYANFFESIDVDYLLSIQDDEEFKDSLAECIFEVIRDYNEDLEHEVTNDPLINVVSISDLRAPGDLIGFKHK